MTQPSKMIYLVGNDTLPQLRVRFLGLDLGDYDAVKIAMLRDDGIRFVRSLQPDPNDPEVGLLTWQPGDLQQGDHLAEFVLYQGTNRTTFPKREPVVVRVRQRII